MLTTAQTRSIRRKHATRWPKCAARGCTARTDAIHCDRHAAEIERHREEERWRREEEQWAAELVAELAAERGE